MKKLLIIFCWLRLHNWEIHQKVNHHGRLVNYGRDCLHCGKEQYLGRPSKYHPIKFIWKDKP